VVIARAYVSDWIMKITKTNDPAVQLVFAILFAGSGALSVFIFWDSFVEWLRICTLSYEEVRNTPFVRIWTSLRAVVGIMSLAAAGSFLSKYFRLRSEQKKKGDSVA
jgi:hypothetical protein